VQLLRVELTRPTLAFVPIDRSATDAFSQCPLSLDLATFATRSTNGRNLRIRGDEDRVAAGRLDLGALRQQIGRILGHGLGGADGHPVRRRRGVRPSLSPVLSTTII
jgi:hypothetical protein